MCSGPQISSSKLLETCTRHSHQPGKKYLLKPQMNPEIGNFHSTPIQSAGQAMIDISSTLSPQNKPGFNHNHQSAFLVPFWAQPKRNSLAAHGISLGSVPTERKHISPQKITNSRAQTSLHADVQQGGITGKFYASWRWSSFVTFLCLRHKRAEVE
ncbi:MAG TPA: hypothetical protein DD979_18260 [Gammaproteobacteria bacterium]|nr:hypothetical protein [Gammaproteobacteria bacterium]